MNRNIKLVSIISSIVMLFVLCMLSTINVQAQENRTVIENAGYYGVKETLEDVDLEYGLGSINYKHDDAYSAITNQNWIVGCECGGSTYSNKSFIVNKEYHQSAHILTIPKDSNMKIVPWSVIKNGKWSLSTILTVAKDYEAKHPGWKVIAGINGDFFDINATSAYPYAVIGTMVSENEVLRTNSSWPVCAFKNDGSDVPIFKVDSPQFKDNASLTIYDNNNEVVAKYDVEKVNSDINGNEIGVYFANYSLNGNAHVCNEIDIADAYIVGNATTSVAYANYSFYGKGEISDTGSATLGVNQFAIKTNNSDVKAKLAKGVTIRVQFELDGELEGCDSVCGCVATFLENGEHVVKDHYDYMEYRYPRTLVGYTEEGSVVFAVTDGRQPNSEYYGLNGIESAAQMKHYGCVEAYSFDGGGSSTMCILKDGELQCVNSPSDGSLRNDGNAILIVTKVPELELSCGVTQTSASVFVNRLEELEGYTDYYVSLNGQMVEVKDGKATFDGLASNTEYKYQLYVKKGNEYGLMPYSGNVTTSKDLYTIDNLKLSLSGNKYKVEFNLNDPQKCIVTCVLVVGGKRYDAKSGNVEISMSQGSPATCDSKLIVTYELNTIDGRKVYEEKTYDLVFNDCTTALASFKSEIEYRLNDMIK